MSTEALNKRMEFLSVDLEKLMAPVSTDSPSGESLRYAGTYDAIEEARRSDDPSLPQGAWQRELKQADWNHVMILCLDALETRTKDLQIAAWLMETWTRLHGFSGVHQGLQLLIGLCESFWEDIHPRIEEGDVEARLAPVVWVNEKLPATLKRVPVTQPETEDASPYSWQDWEAALQLNRLRQKDPEGARKAETKGKLTRDKFLVSVSLTPIDYYRQLAGQLSQGIESTDELGNLLNAKCGQEAPSLGKLKSTLEEIHAFVMSLLKERGDEEGETVATEEDDEAQDPSEPLPFDESSPRTYASGPIKSRAEAYRRLAEAADYLSRVEPHSPTSYLVKRAVSWGNMPLNELLEELLRDNADRATVYKLLGIKGPSGKAD